MKSNGFPGGLWTWFSAAAALGVAAIVFWVYSPALHGGFELDDNLFLASPQVTLPGDPWYLLKPGQPRPLTYLTFYWNFRAAGSSPWGYHLVNLLLHSANTLLVWLLALLLVRTDGGETTALERWMPLTAAALFGLHPIQSEPVCYIYQRATLLAGLFVIAAMILYQRSAHITHRRGFWRFAAVCSAGLAIASKESALGLVLVWGAWRWAHFEGSWSEVLRSAGRQRMRVILFLAGLLLTAAAALSWSSSFAASALSYGAAQLRVVADYLRMLVWPTGLSIDHDVRPLAFLSIQTGLCGVLIASLIALAVYGRRWNRMFSFLGASFFLFLAPTSSLIPRDDLMFEHRLYLPMIAFAILVPWVTGTAAVRLASQRSKFAVPAWGLILAIALASAATVTRSRARIWGDSILLWGDAAEKAPRKARVRYNLASAWLPIDRQRARLEFEKTLELSPDHGAALYNIGWLEQTSGRFDQARSFYERALRADPRQWRAEQNLGNLAAFAGRLAEAERHFLKVAEQKPDYAPALQSAATAQIQLGKLAEAGETLERWRIRQPESLDARYLNAYRLSIMGRPAEAEEELRQIEARDSQGAFRKRIEELRASLPRP